MTTTRTAHLHTAFLALQSAQEELLQFAEAYPGRVDENLKQTTLDVKSALSRLDADFYTDHEAEPLTTRTFRVRLAYRGRREIAADDLQYLIDDGYSGKGVEEVEVDFESEAQGDKDRITKV